MAVDSSARAVRAQLGLGRLLPLGGPADGVWIAERAAAGVLREAEHAVPGVRLESLRIGPAEPDAHDWGAARAANPAAPPSALPCAPLRVEADFAAGVDRPLPGTAALLRAALADAADRRLGLPVTEIDLRVVGLLESGSGTAITVPAITSRPADPPPGAGVDRVAVATTAVPGVVALTARLPGAPDAAGQAVRVQIAVDAGHRALDVALAVRAALTTAVGQAATAVLVTDIVHPDQP